MTRVVSSRTPGRRLLALCAFVALLVAGLTIAACAPDPSAALMSPELGDQLRAQLAGEELVREPTPVPPKLAELTDEQIYAGVPDDLLVAIQASDASAGATIALSVQPTCTGCHSLDPAAMMTGPTWHNVGDHAVEHAMAAGSPGPAEYLHQSIVNPGQFVVPGFTAGVMPDTYDESLSQEDLATLIAYLLDQNGQP